MSKNKNILDRRNFLKVLGGATAVTSAALVGCDTKSTRGGTTLNRPKEGEMTYRINNSTGDKVSLLGYGCMRWPLLPTPAADGNVIDQDAVNELVDHAIAHGINYFDTAPVYVQGWSETSTGIALKRHPRDKYFVATKLSNFDPKTWNRESSLEIYHNSFKKLQVDYIDYLLLHAIGGGGMATFNGRFIDNGMLDFLIEERKAGRIRNLGFSYHGDIEVFDHLLSRHDEIKWDFVMIQLNYVDWLHAKQVNPSNTNAEYLYGELDKRDISTIIMEPILGGRLAILPEHLEGSLKQDRTSIRMTSSYIQKARMLTSAGIKKVC